jgi:sugar-specific transcriptional regulator TrmB
MVKYDVLRKLGLSKTSAACYEQLYKHGAATAAQLAEQLNLPRTGLYRIMAGLETKGFVHAVKTTAQPTYYYAEQVDTALSNMTVYHKHLAADLIKQQREAMRRQNPDLL